MSVSPAIFLILLRMFPGLAEGASPLFYRTLAFGQVEARVEKICIAQVPFRDTTLMERREPDRDGYVEVQIISLQVLEIENFTIEAANVPEIVEGQTLDIVNPYPEQIPALKTGQKIRARIRLVIPEEQFNPEDPRLQWWLYPPGAEESISPPRDPAPAIEILE